MRIFQSLRHVSVVVLLVGGLFASNAISDAGSTSIADAATSAPPVTFDGPVHIGHGRTIFLFCEGTGSPTVVLESGYHDNGALWSQADPTPPAVGPGSGYDQPGLLV
jgi:hypothetical protein